MVNLGPSKGCHTCKARRIKCDQGEPECQRCLRSQRPCGGYAKKPVAFKFKNQTSKLLEAGNARRQEIQNLPPAEEQLAVCFFVKNFATLGRDLASTRGFFELIPPILSSETSDSPLSLAITAVSMRLWRLWCNGNGELDENDVVQKHVSRALDRLKQAINDPIESKMPATILAATALQLDENISASRGLTKPSRIHHEGAMALAKHQAANKGNVTSGNYALFHVLHNEVFFAIRARKPVATDLIDHVLERGTACQNLSAKLDLIGASIVMLQWRLSLATTDTCPRQPLLDIYLGALSMQTALWAWRAYVPSDWYPLRMDRIKPTKPPIVTYRGCCHVYLSIQIAAIWNTYRCFYLTLLRIIIATDPLNHEGFFFPEQEASWIQELVDEICHSIPFYLGNCTWPLSLADVSNSSLQYPSSHDLRPYAKLPPWAGQATRIMSSHEHTCHVLAQGAWHISMPLRHLVELLSGDGGLGVYLRPGQEDWIRGQLLRIGKMLQARGK